MKGRSIGPSNLTRFFLNQVGIPPSEYRRVYARAEVSP